jgi:hypothetical protein
MKHAYSNWREYKKGAQARKDGKPRYANPFSKFRWQEMQRAYAWDWGWQEGENTAVQLELPI